MRVLVTGGAGYIGSGVVEQLLASGHSAVVYDSLYKGHRDAVHPQAEFIQADLLDAAALTSALDRVEAVVHMAADSGLFYYYDDTTYEPFNLGLYGPFGPGGVLTGPPPP